MKKLKYVSKKQKFKGHWPYFNKDVINWIIEQKVSLVGSDTNTDDPELSVHHEVILKNGIFNLEFMNFEELLADSIYEFLFVFTPLRLKGATGSPGRPIAVR